MYTLLLIVIAMAHDGSGDKVVATHFRVPSKETCDQTARLLAAQSNRDLVVKAFCVPRS